jgi:hypothetical protein
METRLGKIGYAEFGVINDYPFMLGLQLEFSFSGSGCGDGGKYSVNITDSCKWDSDQQKYEAYERILKFTYETLKKAKVDSVSKLKGIPVEVTMENNWFKDFRILEEVL